MSAFAVPQVLGGAASRELYYEEKLTGTTVSSTNSAAPTAILAGQAITFDGVTRVKIEVFAAGVQIASNGSLILGLYDNGVFVKALTGQIAGGAVTAGAPHKGEVIFTPSAGSHTYSIGGYVGGGNASIFSENAGYSRTWMRITTQPVVVGGDGSNNAGRELAYAEVTTPVTITGTTEASPSDVVSLGAVVYEARPIMLEFFCANVDASTAAAILFCLWDGSTELCRFSDYRPSAAGSAPVIGRMRLTPSAGSHTYKIRGFKTAGTVTLSGGSGSGGVTTYNPIYMRATLV